MSVHDAVVGKIRATSLEKNRIFYLGSSPKTERTIMRVICLLQILHNRKKFTLKLRLLGQLPRLSTS